jgi:hypothetical protein
MDRSIIITGRTDRMDRSKGIKEEVKFKVNFNDIYTEGEQVFRGKQINEFA